MKQNIHNTSTYSTHLLRHLRLTIGQSIHQHRSRHKMPLRKLARFTGISELLLDHYELGKRNHRCAKRGYHRADNMKREVAQVFTFQREKLYEEIWSVPILQLAKQYGLSDVGLAKICTKMKIPRLPRGYWAKRQNGHEVKKQPRLAVIKNAVQATAIDKSAEELLHMARNRASGSKVRHAQRQRIHRLQNVLKDWEASHRIRAFVSAMRASARAADSDQAEFLAWAETYANHLDPTINFRIETLEDL